MAGWLLEPKARIEATKRPFGTLIQLVTHDCTHPALPDETRLAIWICPVCGTQWSWTRSMLWYCDERTYALQEVPGG